MTELKEFDICISGNIEEDGLKYTADIEGINTYCFHEGGYEYGGGGAPWEDIFGALIKCMVDLNHTANPYSNILITQIEDVLKTYKKVMDWENE